MSVKTSVSKINDISPIKNEIKSGDRGTWTLPVASFSKKEDKRSKIDPDKIQFNTIIPIVETTKGKNIIQKDIPTKVRGNPEDRIAPFYVDMLNRVISKESTSLKEDSGSCETMSDKEGGLTSFLYQDFLRRYIQVDTPERGVLIYHGLGSGKTATSIGMIEANMSSSPKTPVYVILPASLRDNYRSEIRKFSPVLFGNGLLTNIKYWKFITLLSAGTSPEIISEDTGIPVEIIVKNGGVFVLEASGNGNNMKDSTTRMEMDDDTRKKLDEQIISMLLTQIKFISSNGLSRSRALALNFNNSVIVIDEVHKVSGMYRNQRGNPTADDPGGIGRILYNKIKDAKRAKVIALSGTPLINSPFEIAILANMIHGKIEKIRIPLIIGDTRKGDDRDEIAIIEDVLEDSIIRYANIEPSTEKGRGTDLVIIRQPEGFESIISKGTREYMGVYRTETTESIAANWLEMFVERMRIKGIILDRSKAKEQTGLWFPEKEEEFLRMYIDESSIRDERVRLKHEESLLRRLMLISYYRGADPRRLPRTGEIRVIETEMSGPQFEEYARERFKEIDQGMKNKQRQGDDDDGDNFTGRYRSRQLCNFMIPGTRPTIMSTKNELRLRGADTDEMAVDKEYNRLLDDTIKRIKEIPDLLTNLDIYSPKMKGIIQILEESIGLSLIYSSFLRMEGLELMGVILEAAGYHPIRIVGDISSPRIEGLITEDEKRREEFIGATYKRYMIFSGDTEEEFRPYVIRMYRGEFDRLPESLREDIKILLGDNMKDKGKDNLRGELCRVLMITSAGAEGLNLKAVRSVHILEPYWNKARLDQVFGRAVRICSHMDLPDIERYVDRYIHVAKFPQKIMEEMFAKGTNLYLRETDEEKTTDQYLYQLSKIKEALNGAFVDLMRKSAIDCPLNADANGMLLSECYVTPRGKTYLRNLISPEYKEDLDDENRIIEEGEVDTIVVEVGRSIFETEPKGEEIEMGPIQVAVDVRTGIAYDADLMIIRKPYRVGRLEIRDDKETGVPVATIVLEESLTSQVKTPTIEQNLGVGVGVAAEGAAAEKISRVERIEPEMIVAEEVGGVRIGGVKYKLGKRSGEYKSLLSGESKTSREAKIRELATLYARKYSNIYLPSEKKKGKVLIILMGSPGVGKSSSINYILESLYPIRNPNTGERLTFEDFAFINVDSIIEMMKEYQQRLIIKKDTDGTIIVDKNVITDKDIREIANMTRDLVYDDVLKREMPIIYETTFTNPRHIITNVINKAIKMGYSGIKTRKNIELKMREMGAAAAAAGAMEKENIEMGEIIVMNLYTTSLGETQTRVRERFEKTGRYIGDDIGGSFVKDVWVENKEKRESGEYQDIFLNKKGKYKIDIPVDVYMEINTDIGGITLTFVQKGR
jgi:hypothetical protein